MVTFASNLCRAAEQKPTIWKHWAALIITVAAVTCIYAKVTQAYFCAYDDFIEIHRAAFEDSREPSRVFTTSHFNSYKYRPLGRAVTLVTYSVGHDDPIFFRIRNLGFHLANVILVYVLGWLLFRSVRVSTVGAILFGLHPLVNQTIIGAVWPNTIAHAGFLLALVMFIISLQGERLWGLWLIGGLVSAWLSLLTYDTSISVFGLMCIYLAVHFIRREELARWQFVVAFGGVSGALLGTYFLLRSLFVPHSWEQVTADLPPLITATKNLSMYVFALLSPVDTVLANEWFHTPLPSEIVISHPIVIILGASVLLVALGCLVILWRAKRCSQEVDWFSIVFLMSAIFLPFLPVLAFTSHPSETYLYLSVAFYGLLISYIVVGVLPVQLGRKACCILLSIVVLVVGVSAAATWIRNVRVYRCGETARQILYSLPRLKDGQWEISFATIAEEEASHRYGFYGFRGIDTIVGGRLGELGKYTITRALQLVYKNESLSGEVLQPGEIIAKCRTGLPSHHLCLWVRGNGRIEKSLD